mgnify:CR=1 FL=1
MDFKIIAATAALAFFTTNAQSAIKVACVGNSITEGYGIWDKKKYPEHLQEMLGNDYQVENFGKSSMTFYKGGGQSYWSTDAFTSAYNFAPDIVVIELGTNDAKYFFDGKGSSSGYNYNYYEYSGAKKEDFYVDYEALIDTFAHQSQSPKIYATLQPYAQNLEWGIIDTAIVNFINPLIKQVAEKKGAALIDLHAEFNKKEWLLDDMVHPNETGAKELARIIANAIQNTPTAQSSASEVSSSSSMQPASSATVSAQSSSNADFGPSSSATTAIKHKSAVPNTRIFSQGSTIDIENFTGRITIFDLNGNIVKKAKVSGSSQIKLERAGSYIVKVHDD